MLLNDLWYTQLKYQPYHTLSIAQAQKNTK